MRVAVVIRGDGTTEFQAGETADTTQYLVMKHETAQVLMKLLRENTSAIVGAQNDNEYFFESNA